MMKSRLPANRVLKCAGVAMLVLSILPVVLSAVLVAPHAVFIDHRSRTGQITLANPGTEPEEIEIELKFGYPETDSSGNPYVKLIDDPPPGAPSAAGWIRAFPRRVRLEPGQRQVVRLLATPPADLPDGEYWSRVIVTSRKIADVVASPDTTLRAGLALELRTIISVMYRKGSVNTGVVLKDLQPRLEGDSLIAWVDLERLGNAAYLGTIRFTMLDEAERVVNEWTTPVAVYYTHNRRFAFSLDTVPPGQYHVRFEVTTERKDLDQNNILPADSVVRSFGLEKPEQ